MKLHRLITITALLASGMAELCLFMWITPPAVPIEKFGITGFIVFGTVAGCLGLLACLIHKGKED
jgi:hypothetical protein